MQKHATVKEGGRRLAQLGCGLISLCLRTCLWSILGGVFVYVFVCKDHSLSFDSSHGHLRGYNLTHTKLIETKKTSLLQGHPLWDSRSEVFASSTGLEIRNASILPCGDFYNVYFKLNSKNKPAENRQLRSIRRDPRPIIDTSCAPPPKALDAGYCVRFAEGGRKVIACLPSLIIFGFQKCGTAELQGWLSAHPALHRWQGNEPQKHGAGEANYFNHRSVSEKYINNTWIPSYLQQGFVLTKPTDISRIYTFEKSPNYGIMSEMNIYYMHQMLPSIKLIALLRNPTSRAYSGFQHTCKKGRVFLIDPLIASLRSNSKARNRLRNTLAGRVILAENKTQATEALFIRFGRYTVYESHIAPLQYPCPPWAFDNFLMLPTLVENSSYSNTNSEGLDPEVAESLLDLRSKTTQTTTILEHGNYADSIQSYLKFFPREQLQIYLTEELQHGPVELLSDIQHFLGVPQYDFAKLAQRDSQGHISASFQKSKTDSSTYAPMSSRAKEVLDGYYKEPNRKLSKLISEQRLEKWWGITYL
eukprot:m.20715 g.20715  ORF g.20715 m.20715 type:complete len:531 (-) comp6928_c0_seq2:62-1654(-)